MASTPIGALTGGLFSIKHIERQLASPFIALWAIIDGCIDVAADTLHIVFVDTPCFPEGLARRECYPAFAVNSEIGRHKPRQTGLIDPFHNFGARPVSNIHP